MQESVDNFPIREALLERPLPSAPDSECAALSGIILDNVLIAQAITLLKPTDFYAPSNKRIFLAMISLFERGEEITPNTICEELRKKGLLESSGGVMYVNSLTDGQYHISNLKNLARIIRGYSVMRMIAKAGDKMRAEALEAEGDPQDVLQHAQKAVFDIALSNQQKSFVRIGDLTEQNLESTYAISQAGSSLIGVTSGYPDLDSYTLGWRKGDLIIIAGRPGQGKTSLALCMAVNAVKQGKKVAFFSLEMTEEELTSRILCSEARIDSRLYQTGYLTEDDWAKLGDVHNSLKDSDLFIDETPAQTVLQMKSKTMQLIAEHGNVDEVIIDYLGLVTSDNDNKRRTREREIADMTSSVKASAKELGIPHLLLCQLNRQPENRNDHRPKLSDLRESGAVEQDADVVAFVYRCDEYKEKDEPKDNTAEIILAKQRKGAKGTVYLRYDDKFTRFDNLISQ